jgi:hypothetical protein
MERGAKEWHTGTGALRAGDRGREEQERREDKGGETRDERVGQEE